MGFDNASFNAGISSTLSHKALSSVAMALISSGSLSGTWGAGTSPCAIGWANPPTANERAIAIPAASLATLETLNIFTSFVFGPLGRG